MIKRTLTDYLEKIGRETHDTGYIDATGTVRPIIKDETLARLIWRQALGYEEEIKNIDGTCSHRTYSPDPKMQQFLIERREGKNVEPQEDRSASLLDKISELAKAQANAMAEKSVDDRDDSKT